MVQTGILRCFKMSLGFVYFSYPHNCDLSCDNSISMICRCMGFNVRSVDLKKRASMLILSVNVVLIVTVIFNLTDTVSSFKIMNSTKSFNRTLFPKLIRFYYIFFLPMWIIFSMFYFFTYGPEILRLLDFFYVEYKKTSRKIICMVLVIIFHIVFILDYSEYQLEIFNKNRILESLFKLYLGYILIAPDYLILAIVAYYKYGTLQLLKQTYQDQLRIYPNIQEDFVCQQIRLLAQLNRKISKLTSVLFLIFIIALGTCFQIVVCQTILENNLFYDFSFVIYITFQFACFIYTIHFSTQIDKTMYNISQLLSKYHWRTYNCKNSTKGCVGRYLFQASIYRNDLQLSLFDCITLDYSFIVKFVAFILCYIMIVIQTN